MIAVFALVVSVIALLINIIVNLDKMKKFFEDLGSWQKQRIENKKTIDTANRNALVEAIRKKSVEESQVSKPFELQLSYFLFSVICSAILSFFDFPSVKSLGAPSAMDFSEAITILVLTYIFIGWAFHIFFEKFTKYLPSRRRGFLLELYHAMMMVYTWGVMTFMLIFISIPPFYAGLISSVTISIITFFAWNNLVKFIKSVRNHKE